MNKLAIYAVAGPATLFFLWLLRIKGLVDFGDVFFFGFGIITYTIGMGVGFCIGEKYKALSQVVLANPCNAGEVCVDTNGRSKQGVDALDGSCSSRN